MKDTVLVGTFISQDRVPRSVVRSILESFNSDKIFIFLVLPENDNKEKFLITFNITHEEREAKLREYIEKYKNTIQLHRNKEYNTLYTINSLNEVVNRQNGQTDKDYKVDWSEYKNCCLVLNGQDLKVLKTRLYDIIEMEN